MLTHLDNLGPVNLADPVHRQHPLNRNRSAWWLTLPQLAGGVKFYDLMGLNHGALTSMTSGATAGWRSTTRPGGYGALLFDSIVSSSVNMTPSPSLSPTVAMSVSLWVNLTAAIGSGYTLVAHDDGTNRSFALRATATGFRFFVGAGSGSLFSTTVPTVGQWYHVAATYDGAATRIYVNGQMENTASTSVAIPTGAAIFSIGISQASSFFLPLTGYADDVGFWTHAISTREVWELYNLSRTGYPGLLNRWPSRMVDGASGGGTVSGAAALVGAGLLSASGTAVVLGTGQIVGVGSLDAAATAILSGTAAVVGVGSLGASGVPIVSGAAALNGVGLLSGLGTPVVNGAANLTGIAILTPAGLVISQATANLLGVASLNASAFTIVPAQGAMVAVGVLLPNGTVQVVGQAAVSGVAALGAAGTTVVLGQAGLSGVGILAAQPGAATIAGTATLIGVSLLGARGPRLPIIVIGATTSGDELITIGPGGTA